MHVLSSMLVFGGLRGRLYVLVFVYSFLYVVVS